MKKTINGLILILTILLAVLIFTPAAFAEQFADQDVSIVTKLPPQYLDWRIHTSSANPQNQTVPWYYKVSAVVTGLGEINASPVTTGYSATGPLVSTNSLRIMWSPVTGATSYNLYKSVDNISFFLLTNTPLLTYIDIGAALGAAYSAPSPRGGNLAVENDIDVGGNVVIDGNLTVTAVMKAPSLTLAAIMLQTAVAGEMGICSDCTPVEIFISTGAGAPNTGGYGTGAGLQLN